MVQCVREDGGIPRVCRVGYIPGHTEEVHTRAYREVHTQHGPQGVLYPAWSSGCTIPSMTNREVHTQHDAQGGTYPPQDPRVYHTHLGTHGCTIPTFNTGGER